MSISWDMTLKEFREKFNDEDFVDGIYVLREEVKKEQILEIYNFDFIMACLLGGTANKETSSIAKKYWEKIGTASSKSTWVQNFGGAFKSDSEIELTTEIARYLNDELQGINDDNTLNYVKELLNSGKLEKIVYPFQFKDKEKVIKALEFIVEREFSKNMSENNTLTEQKLRNLIESDVKQIILTGAPGTGKTYLAKKIAEELGNKLGDKKYYELVQFHPSYDYTDFVEGLRPVEINGGNVTFKKIDGIFKRFCRDVVVMKRDNKDEAKTNKRYFFIIDEINRADLSKVFGELMYGLERDKRGEKNWFKTQYQNLPTYDIDNKRYMKKDIFKEGFFIPEEVYIIGTMNDIDRSVESMDFALRRRFHWIEVKVEEELKQAFKNTKINEEGKEEYILLPFIEKDREEIVGKIIDRIGQLNEHINGEGEKYLLNEHYFIAHGYFANLPDNIINDGDSIREKIKKILEYVWTYRLESLIKEYVRGEKEGQDFVGACKFKFTEVPKEANEDEFKEHEENNDEQ